MSQPTRIVPIEGGRLILGFDGGCMTCSALAERIKELAGEKLEVLNLRDPQVTEWRRRALGEGALRAPTLIEVKGLKVRAWTGWQMGIQLGHRLGPVATWRVMQALGEIGATPKIEQSSVVEKLPGKAAEVVVGMSRGQFLKGVGGVAVAMGVLSGFEPFARPAAAIEGWQYPNFAKSRQFYGAELRDHCNRMAQRNSCEWTAGAWASAMQSGMSVSGSDDGVAQGGGVKARAAVHHTASGNRMWATTFDLRGDKLLVLYEWENMRNGVKWEAKRWGFGPSLQTMWAERMDMNGDRFTDPSAPSLQATCPPTCESFTGSRQIQTCNAVDFRCLGRTTATCLGAGAACASVPLTTIAGGIACASALFLCGDQVFNNCCTSVCTVCTSCAPLTT